MNKIVDVIIVGGGLGGVAVLHHIVKRANALGRSLTVLLLEQAGAIGGLAYSTSSEAQILNVPAGKMGIDDEAPGGFFEWLCGSGERWSTESFVPRSRYRGYLESIVTGVAAQSRVSLIREVVQVDGIEVIENASCVTVGGRPFAAAPHVVIALGNSLGDEEIAPPFSHPWRADDLIRASATQRVAIIGSSLSAVDVILDLENRGFSGEYSVISRRGLFPQSHQSPHPSGFEGSVQELFSNCESVRTMLRAFRGAVRRGADWRMLLDSLRCETPRLWGQLSDVEKMRFARHLRPYWDIHRHRIPRESWGVIQALIESHRLKVSRRRFRSIHRDTADLVLVSSHAGIVFTERVDSAFDCRGLWTDLLRARNPLVQSILDLGLGETDTLRMGFRCDDSGRLITVRRKSAPALYTLGSLRRGELWETTAAREIRIQAARIGQAIVNG
jgi:uncharacterized NAD(P)/FAD-binding protein YdhS